jgi:hypothetical protein
MWMVRGGARQDLSKKMEIFIRFVELGWTGKSSCYLFAVLMVGSILPVVFETLLVRWPRLRFQIVSMVTEAWVLGTC